MTTTRSIPDGSLHIDNLWKVYPLYGKQMDRLKEAVSLTRTKYHSDHYALQAVSFDVTPGESLGIIGKNGSGKSTLLKVVSGVISPSAGDVRVGGRIAALLELGAGFNPEFTGRENVFLHGRIHGIPQDQTAAMLPSIEAFAEIDAFFDQPVKHYSSGMFVRLAFAAAIHTEPDILIVDEALSVGDAAFQAKCMRRIQRMADNGVTILFVTHDMSTIKRLCSRCVYLEDGLIKAEGDAQDIADMYLADMRERMNREVLASFGESGETFHDYETGVPCDDFFGNMSFTDSAAFHDRVADRREGTGQVRFCNVQVCDESGTGIAVFEYDQKMIIRLHVRFEADEEVNIGYHIRDNRNTELCGSNTVFEDYGLLAGIAGDTYVVDFEFDTRLAMGDYNVTVVATKPLLGDEHVVFYDLVEHAASFNVMLRPKMRLWNSMYLDNALTVAFSGNERLQCSCPVCSSTVPEFVPFPKELTAIYQEHNFRFKDFGFETLNYRSYLCPACGASDRERLTACFLNDFMARRNGEPVKILDFAPREGFTDFLKGFPAAEYLSADLYMDNVDLKLDASDMSSVDAGSFDMAIALHVLEHIPDDLAAMREFYRILKPGGCGLFLVPIARNPEKEGESLTAPEQERWARFGQDDHIRQYTQQSFQDRLTEAGFTVSLLGRDHFGLRVFHEYGISESSILYVATRPTTRG